MRQTILIFGGLAAAIALLFQLSKLTILSSQDSSDVFIIIAGCLFILIGFFINRFLYTKSSAKVISPDSNSTDYRADLSKQEHRVLLLMADGLSNMEIANSLFISESTVKTHVSRVLGKLNAKRRTEAVKIGRDLGII
ncbi:MAG: response regulator transcription factor [Roseivirga sp.]|nr:response regulator transcription factor [Roseivirga sp.]